jgi:hypothetical protein
LKRSGSIDITDGNEQRLSNLASPVVDDLEPCEYTGKDQAFSKSEESDEHAEGEQPPGGSEETIVGKEALVDANMDEHGSEQESEETNAVAQPPPAEEF